MNYTNWAKGLYPSRATAEKPLAADTLYVYEEAGEVVSCANLNHLYPKEYANIPWTIHADGNEEPGRTQNSKVIRLDT